MQPAADSAASADTPWQRIETDSAGSDRHVGLNDAGVVWGRDDTGGWIWSEAEGRQYIVPPAASPLAYPLHVNVAGEIVATVQDPGDSYSQWKVWHFDQVGMWNPIFVPAGTALDAPIKHCPAEWIRGLTDDGLICGQRAPQRPFTYDVRVDRAVAYREPGLTFSNRRGTRAWTANQAGEVVAVIRGHAVLLRPSKQGD